MTTKKMMQELKNHGYFFNRPLSDEEIRKEYQDMLIDLQVIEAANSGMNPSDAIKMVFSAKQEEETMKTERNNMCETCANYNPNEDS